MGLFYWSNRLVIFINSTTSQHYTTEIIGYPSTPNKPPYNFHSSHTKWHSHHIFYCDHRFTMNIWEMECSLLLLKEYVPAKRKGKWFIDADSFGQWEVDA